MKIYNTLTRKKEEFTPIEDGVIKIYNCGPTVYGYFHIGNARNFVVFDVIRRYLQFRGFKIKYVQNITDIDDKIINRAKEEGVSASEVASKYTIAYFEDSDFLGIAKADIYPKATEHISDMIRTIQILLDKGYAYVIDGDVYYEVSKFKNYGLLSKQSLDELLSGARVEVDERKKSPLDFALWKKAKPGEPFWDSPWGKGRPGWHIECSVMSMKYLGENFDIHGGGCDLIFPHHENEIAQSEASTGKHFVNFWVHNGHINISGEKMSKSLGNFLLVCDIKKKYKQEVLRFFLLSAHYRSPIDFSEENIKSCEEGYREFYNTISRLRFLADLSVITEQNSVDFSNLLKSCEGLQGKFIEIMDDDFNTASALGSLFSLANEVKMFLARKDFKLTSEVKKTLLNTKNELEKFATLFGICPTEVKFSSNIFDLISERNKSRLNKDWQRADEVRKKLLDLGVIIEDTSAGTIPIYKI
ncbi:MAG: cysteine--tRNA ligase [Candidatus Firestonebacteria bacterium]